MLEHLGVVLAVAFIFKFGTFWWVCLILQWSFWRVWECLPICCVQLTPRRKQFIGKLSLPPSIITFYKVSIYHDFSPSVIFLLHWQWSVYLALKRLRNTIHPVGTITRALSKKYALCSGRWKFVMTNAWGGSSSNCLWSVKPCIDSA